MQFTWDEKKRERNLRKHGLDFADAFKVFLDNTVCNEDVRFFYDERRYLTVGSLAGRIVSIIHTETAHEIRIISFRAATSREADTFFSACGQ